MQLNHNTTSNTEETSASHFFNYMLANFWYYTCEISEEMGVI